MEKQIRNQKGTDYPYGKENPNHLEAEERRHATQSPYEHGWVTGMFSGRDSADRAYNSLHERGYKKDDINLLMTEDTRKKYYRLDDDETELGTKAAEGAGAGSAIGGTIGAIVGVIAAIGTSIVIPGLGLVIAGPLAAGLAGAGAGGITGGIIGALIGLGIPEERAKVYESGLKDGKVVIGVRPRNEEDAESIEKHWKENEGELVFR